MTTHAAIYVRISSDPEGLRAGVDRQAHECRELCERRGWEVVRTYEDNDASAYSGRRRPGYEQLLADVQSGAVGVVVAWASDRLYREMRDLEGFIEVVDRAGAAVATVAGGDLDLTTSEGRLSARIHGAVARQESERKAERLRSWAADRARQGLRHGGARPFGYDVEGKGNLRSHPVEGPLVAEAATDVLLGEPVRTIAGRWNAAGITTVRGRPWGVNSLKRVLTSPRIAGLREHQPRASHEPKGTDLRRLGELTEAAWEPLVTRATWEAVRAVILDSKTPRGAPARVSLLAGLATCGVCGSLLKTGRRPNGARTYVCAGVAGISRRGEGHVARIAEPLEALVIENLPEGPWRLDGRPQAPDLVKLEELGAEASRQRLRLGRIAEAYEAGDYSLSEYRSRKADADSRLRAAEKSIAELRPRTLAIDADEAWAQMTFDRRRALLAELFDEVRVMPTVQGRKGFDRRAVELYTKGGDRLIVF